MRISQEEMASRSRMLHLRSRLTDAIGKSGEELTYAELLHVLAELSLAWSGYLRKADMKTDDGTEDADA